MGFVIITGAATTAMQVEYPSYYEKHPNAAANVIDMAVIYACIETLVRGGKGNRPWCTLSDTRYSQKMENWAPGNLRQSGNALTLPFLGSVSLFVPRARHGNWRSVPQASRLVATHPNDAPEELVVILAIEAHEEFVYVVALLALVVYGYAIVGITLL